MGGASSSMPQLRKVVTIVGIAFFVAINVLHGRQSIRQYLSIGVELNNATEIANVDTSKRTLPLSSGRNTVARTVKNDTEGHKLNLLGRKNTNIPHYENTSSPACEPHFLVANRPNQPLKWSVFSKFKRFYFHHSRKAGERSTLFHLRIVLTHEICSKT